jgi:glycosyltransferase involved in cell wall biosynthesis
MSVVKRFYRGNTFCKNGVQYYFIKDSFADDLKFWQIPLYFLRRIAKLDADVVHLHAFPSSFPTFVLRYLLRKNTAIIIQNHGGKVSEGIKTRLYKLMSNVADAFFFTAYDQGAHWFSRKKQLNKIMPVMEGGTFFNYDNRDVQRSFFYFDRHIAREKTGIRGDPVFLWVGRLDENKDPMTVLAGFEILFKKYSNAALYMIYNDSKLLDAVKKKINLAESLKNKVHLLGEILHEEMEIYYNSADYFVLGSHYEGSGYALSEAISCGCVPVITNIPSFKMMTNDGKLGALWEPGNKDSFINAVDTALNKPLQNEANACIDFFKNKLSFDAIAGIAKQHYQKVINLRRKS